MMPAAQLNTASTGGIFMRVRLIPVRVFIYVRMPEGVYILVAQG
jgi:hypothetical protein